MKYFALNLIYKCNIIYKCNMYKELNNKYIYVKMKKNNKKLNIYR